MRTARYVPVREPQVDAYGVQTVWQDAGGVERAITSEVVETMHAVIGQPPADLEEVAAIVTRPGRAVAAGTVRCEDGTTREVAGTLPEDFPLGYHRLRDRDGRERTLIVSPGRCWLPAGPRAWGWAVQLYATRSAASQGIGDLADMRTLRRWAQGLGAGFLLVNPLHAVAPTLPQQDSPYLPATRRWRNPLYLRVEGLPAGPDSDLIDRDAVWQAKRAVLERLYEAEDDTDAFASWRAQQGESLASYATWAAVAERHGDDWHDWPPELRDPDSEQVAAYARAHAPRVTFHAWLQWQLDSQLRAASGELTLVQDLPIGVDGGGADAWTWQEVFAHGVHVGAPPDRFNAAGQDWGSPPLVPWRLRVSGYEAFAESVRGTIAGAGGLRIDHVMGLFRLWWVPEGGSARDGAYVRYPSEDLLDIVALESHRAQALVIGEDLGTVEPGVRDALAEHGIVSYRVLWFEDDDPADWPVESLAAVTTHDLPTVAGLWGGADLDEQRELGLGSDEQLARGRAALLEHLPGSYGSAEQAVLGAHRLLARAPSRLLCATLEDVVAAERRPNIPGAAARPNWRLPLSLEQVLAVPAARALAAVLDRAVRGGDDGGAGT